VALDSDNASFWAADYCSSDLVQFNLDSGNEVSKFTSGSATNTVYGIAERVAPPRMTPAGPLTAAPAQASIPAGQSATFTLNFTPNGAASGQNFTLACANLPANSSCSFSPPAVQAGGPQNIQLTMTTTGASAQLSRPGVSAWALAFALPGFGVMIILGGSGKDRRRKRLVLACLSLVLLIPLLSCSGAGGSSSSSQPPSNPASPPTPGTATPSGTYTVVVHATSSGGAQSSTAVTLTIQ
jgi:hypothetical protein